jgi:hypothetical protein
LQGKEVSNFLSFQQSQASVSSSVQLRCNDIDTA